MSKTYTVYTDGSYSTNSPDVIGWGYVALDMSGEDDVVVDKQYGSSDNEELVSMRNVGAELLAAGKALRALVDRGAEKIVLYSDYKGVIAWAYGKWKTKKEMTRRYAAYVNKLRCKEGIVIELHWVKGHSGSKYNNYADSLAKEGRKTA